MHEQSPTLFVYEAGFNAAEDLHIGDIGVFVKLPPALVDRLDRFCKRTGQSKRRAITVALSAFLMANESPELVAQVKRLVESSGPKEPVSQ